MEPYTLRKELDNINEYDTSDSINVLERHCLINNIIYSSYFDSHCRNCKFFIPVSDVADYCCRPWFCK